MKTVSLKIDDSIFVETEKILARIKKPRNRYINEAIDFYNKIVSFTRKPYHYFTSKVCRFFYRYSSIYDLLQYKYRSLHGILPPKRCFS
jgi:hypothetical protein